MQFREMSAEEFDSPSINTLAEKIVGYYGGSRTGIRIDPGVVKGSWKGFLEMGIACLIVAEEKGEVYGVIAGVICPDPLYSRKVAQEVFWFVDPAMRHHGIGASLIRLFEAWAKYKGADTLRLSHLVDLRAEENAALYKGLGFSPAEVVYEKGV